MAKHTMQELYQWQALPLNIKVLMTAERVRSWVDEFGEDGVYLSFSAGKDSTVLGHIIREVCGYKNIPFWTEQDVLLYIKENNLPICSVYGEVVTDYEAMGQCENQMSFADFGIFDKERPLLKTTGCQRTGCVLCGFGCHLEKESRFLRLKETHPKFHNLLYVLKNNGVTYAEAIDWVNEHGNMNIKY